jgi:hypothetical protein
MIEDTMGLFSKWILIVKINTLVRYDCLLQVI